MSTRRVWSSTLSPGSSGGCSKVRQDWWKTLVPEWWDWFYRCKAGWDIFRQQRCSNFIRIKRNNFASSWWLFEGALWIEPALSIELYADRFGVLANNCGKTQPAFCCMSSFMAELWEAWVSLQTCFPFWHSHRVTWQWASYMTDMAFFECPGGVKATLQLLMRAAEAAETRTGVAMGCLEQVNKAQCHDMSWLFFCYFWVII